MNLHLRPHFQYYSTHGAEKVRQMIAQSQKILSVKSLSISYAFVASNSRMVLGKTGVSDTNAAFLMFPIQHCSRHTPGGTWPH